MPAAPTLYILAGPNGSGKTTLAHDLLPRGIKCLNFLNADLLAQGLSPLDPTASLMRAGRILLHEFDHNVTNNISFGIETTLSGLTYLDRFRDAKEKGYRLILFYIWIGSIELSLDRIRDRVSKGGHDVSVADVTRRFPRSVRHFFNYYRLLADEFTIFDNRYSHPIRVAYGTPHDETVFDSALYTELLSIHDKAD